MHEIHGSILDVMQIGFFVFPCMYQYMPSTYQVQQEYILVHTCKCFGIPSTNKYVLSDQRCADLDVPSTKLKCQNPQDCDMNYKEVCTGAERYCTIACGVLIQHCAN